MSEAHAACGYWLTDSPGCAQDKPDMGFSRYRGGMFCVKRFVNWNSGVQASELFAEPLWGIQI